MITIGDCVARLPGNSRHFLPPFVRLMDMLRNMSGLFMNCVVNLFMICLKLCSFCYCKKVAMSITMDLMAIDGDA
jgi:hypothetical protein